MSKEFDMFYIDAENLKAPPRQYFEVIRLSCRKDKESKKSSST